MGIDHSRKLAAIMFTDIVGYSRMMSADEDHALRLLDIHDSLLTATIADHGGHVLKRMGDAIFAEFDSATQAVRCGIRIQERLREHNQSAAAGDQLSVRIGIHLGEVVVREKDLFGEGINVAARLESLARPGGICISDAVYQAVKRHAGIEPVLVGEVELKNIVERHVIYQFPPFYEVEKAGGNDKHGTEVIESRGAINLVRTDILPAASGFPRLLVLIASVVVGMIASVIYVSLVVDSRADAWRFTQREFQDARHVVRALTNAQSGLEQQIWRAFSGESRRELAELVADSMSPSNDRKVTWTLRQQLSHIVTGARQLDPPKEGREGEFAEPNRRTIERLFPDQITVQVKEKSALDRVAANLDFRWAGTWGPDPFVLAVIGSIIGVIWYSYWAIRPASHRYVFDDIRNVDEVIEYLIREMGFNAPVRDGKMLRFRATLKTVFIWSVLGIGARIDGTSVIVSGQAHFLRRLKKSLETISGASPSLAPSN